MSIVVLMSACGEAQIAAGVQLTGTSSLKPARGTISITAQAATLTNTWESAFAGSRWKLVEETFANHAEASALISRMIHWRAERIRHLHIDVTFVHPLSAGRYVATLRFLDDPRAVPEYRIYLLSTDGTRSRVAAATTGLQGNTFTSVRWSVTRSKHFVIFHSPYEVQGADRSYLAGLEYQRAQFEREFGVRLPVQASYYLYPTTSLMAHLTGDTCGANPDNVGCTNPYTQPPLIQTSLWPTYHEPIHVYQLALVPPPSHNSITYAPLFIAEGTAVALEDRWADPRLSDYCSTLIYIPLDACAQVAIQHTHPLNLLTDRAFKHADGGDAYALAGSFVKFLIVEHGSRAFGKFYYKLAAQPSDTLKDYNVAANAVYHASLTRLLSDWERLLCSHGCG